MALSNEVGPPPFQWSSFSNIVVFHQGALGDFLLALPALEGLCHIITRVRMDFCCKVEYGELIAGKPYLGNVYPCDSSEFAPFFHDALWGHATIPSSFQQADAIFIFGQASTQVLAERLSTRLSRPVHWIRSFPGREEVEPVGSFLVRQLRALGWPVEAASARIEPSHEEVLFVRERLAAEGCDGSRKPILVHPGSGGWRKIWPLARWWGLLHWLCRKVHRPVFLSLGPADEPVKALAQEAEKLGIHLLEGVSLRRLAAWLSESALYIGNDSGVSHLAAAVGAPTVVLFGPTTPEVWAPQGKNVHIIHSRWHESEVLSWHPDPTPPPVEIHVRELLECLLK